MRIASAKHGRHSDRTGLIATPILDAMMEESSVYRRVGSSGLCVYQLMEN